MNPTFNVDYLSKVKYDQDTATAIKNICSPIDIKGTKQDLPFPSDTLKTLTVGLISFIPEVGPILSFLVDTVWTNYIEVSQKQTEFSEYKSLVQEMLDQSFDAYDFEKVCGYFKATNSAMELLRESLANLKPKPNNAALRLDVKLKINGVEQQYISAIAAAQTKGFQIIELPLYVMLCTGYLILCRDITVNGKSWGYNDATITSYKQKLTSKRQEYQVYCGDRFNDQIAAIKSTLAPNNDVLRLNKLISFKAAMTIHVFDYVQLWESMDLNLYPNGCRLEFCRYVYSPVHGLPVTGVFDKNYFNKTCDSLIDTWVGNENECYRKELKQMVWFKERKSNNFFISFYCKYSDDTSATGLRDSLMFGSKDQKGEPSYVCDFNGQEQQVTLDSDFVPRVVRFSSSQNDHMINEPFKFLMPTMIEEIRADFYYHTHFPSFCTFPGEPSEESLNRYDPLDEETHVIRSKSKRETVGFKNHKVGTAFGYGSNDDAVLSLTTTKSGFLDSFCVGFAPTNLYRTNVINTVGTTIISSQKYIGTKTVPFILDFYSPYYWCGYMQLKKAYSGVKYSFEVPPGTPLTSVFYKLTLRTTATGPSEIAVTNKLGGLAGTIKIIGGTAIDNTATFNINIGKGLNSNHFTFSIPNLEKNYNVQLIAIILNPSPPNSA